MASNDTARRRALQAARAVTLGLAVGVTGSGCFSSHERPRPEREPEPEMATADAAVARDAGTDAGGELCNAGDRFDECCEEHMWDPAWGCFAWGPFVPPAERGVA